LIYTQNKVTVIILFQEQQRVQN